MRMIGVLLKNENNKKIIAFIWLIAALPYMMFLAEDIPEAVYFSFLPLIIGAWLLKKNVQVKNEYTENLHRCISILSIIMTFLFIAMLSLSQIISFIVNAGNNAPTSNEKIQILVGTFTIIWSLMVYFPSLVLSTYYVFRLLFCSSIVFTKSTRKRTISTKFLVTIIAVVSFVCLFATYPNSYNTYDVISVYNQIVDPSTMSDWHTIGYVYFCYICCFLFKSTFMVDFVQTLFWIFLNYRIISYLNSKDKSKWSGLTYMATTIFLFTPYVYLSTMLKDIIFSIVILGFTLFIVKLLNHDLDKWDIFLGSLAGLGVVLFRHAQLLTAILSLLAITVWFALKKEKKLLIKTVSILLIIVMGYIIVVPIYSYKIRNIEENPSYVSYSIPIAMIGAAIDNGVGFNKEDTELLETVMPLERWAECYNKYYMDDISRSWGVIGDDIYTIQEMIEDKGFGKELIRLNAQILIKHPLIYMTTFFDANTIVWEIGTPIDGHEDGIATYPGDSSTKYFGFWKIIDHIIDLGAELPIYKSFATRGGIHVLTLCFLCFVAILKKNAKMILAAFPILVFTMLLFISVPAAQTRYIIPIMECSTFLFAYMYFMPIDSYISVHCKKNK